VSTDTTTKISAARLARDAYLYVRQSTLYQVVNNTESTMRQYDLKGRAVALGWPPERIHVIDVDQGHSGASAADHAHSPGSRKRASQKRSFLDATIRMIVGGHEPSD
jgi:hypothetical protein